MKWLKRSSQPLGGFAGLTEKRLVMSERIFGPHKQPSTFDGLGAFVYLADANFNPYGDTRMHPHKEIDIISVMVKGRLRHEGSLKHGSAINTGDIQVQRAGQEGFSHNEINPDNEVNRMIQLWFTPEVLGGEAGYMMFTNTDEKVTRVYGGKSDETFKSKTIMEVVRLQTNDEYDISTQAQVYILTGDAILNNHAVQEGDFLEDNSISVHTQHSCGFIAVYMEK